MQITIPDQLYSDLVVKAEQTLPAEGDSAAKLAVNNLIKAFIASKSESVVFLNSPKGRLLTLSEINDSFFEQFIAGAQRIYPNSEKPEVDFLMDSMASLVNVDERVILMHSIPAANEDALIEQLDQNFGGGSQAIYALLGKLLLKAKNQHLLTIQLEQDLSTPEKDSGQVMVVMEGLAAPEEASKVNSVVSLLLTRFIKSFYNIDFLAVKKLEQILESLFGYKKGFTDFFSNLIKKYATGKAIFVNAEKAPFASALDVPLSGSYCLVIDNVSEQAMQTMRVYSRQLAAQIKTQTGSYLKAYDSDIGFLIYLLDIASVDNPNSASIDFSVSDLTGLLKNKIPDEAKTEGVNLDGLEEFLKTARESA